MHDLRLKTHILRRPLHSVIIIVIKFSITITIIEIRLLCANFDTQNYESFAGPYLGCLDL